MNFGDNIFSVELFLDPFPVYGVCPPQQTQQRLGDSSPSSSSSSDTEDFQDSQQKDEWITESCQPPAKRVKMEK